jgi:hypothetical protein
MQQVKVLDYVDSPPEHAEQDESQGSSIAPTAAAMPSPSMPPPVPQSNAVRGIGGVFDLDPRIAVLAIVTDMILFAGDVVTFGGFMPVAFLFAIGLGFITYEAQITWHQDDRKSALIKAAIVAFLTALPGPITPFFAVPSVIMSVVKRIRRR